MNEEYLQISYSSWEWMKSGEDDESMKSVLIAELKCWFLQHGSFPLNDGAKERNHRRIGDQFGNRRTGNNETKRKFIFKPTHVLEILWVVLFQGHWGIFSSWYKYFYNYTNDKVFLRNIYYLLIKSFRYSGPYFDYSNSTRR